MDILCGPRGTLSTPSRTTNTNSSPPILMNNPLAPYGNVKGIALDVIVVSPPHYSNHHNKNDNRQAQGKEAAPQATPAATTPCTPSSSSRKRTFKTRHLNTVMQEPSSSSSSSPSISNNNNTTSHGIFASSDFAVQFPNVYPTPSSSSSTQYTIRLQINGTLLEESFCSMQLPTTTTARREHESAATTTTTTTSLEKKTMCTFVQGRSMKPPTQVLETLTRTKTLLYGKNLIRFLLIRRDVDICPNNHDKDNPHSEEEEWKEVRHVDTPIGLAEAHVYLWSVYDRIVISDIDGTVTKSDVRGVMDSIVLKRYVHAHEGVCAFFSQIVQQGGGDWGVLEEQEEKKKEEDEEHEASGGGNGQTRRIQGQTRILYLSSRPMSLIETTRNYISNLNQQSSSFSAAASSSYPVLRTKNSSSTNPSGGSSIQTTDLATHRIRLPHGPIFLHTGSLGTVLVTELVNKSTHLFKADTLERQVIVPFIAAGKDSLEHSKKIFVAAFGNKDTDQKAYEMVGIEKHDIYIINKKSIIASMSKDGRDGGGLRYESDEDFTVIDQRCCCLNDVPNKPIRELESVDTEHTTETKSRSCSTMTYPCKETYNGYSDPNLADAVLNRTRKLQVS